MIGKNGSRRVLDFQVLPTSWNINNRSLTHEYQLYNTYYEQNISAGLIEWSLQPISN